MNALPQLRLASGSLRMYLNVVFAAKLPPPSPVDDALGMLEKFIPPGMYTTTLLVQVLMEYLRAMNVVVQAMRPT